MQRSDALELRRELRKAPNQEGIIDWVYGFYVTADHEVAWESVRKFYSLEDEEKFRHLALINRTLSPSVGIDLFPVPVRQNEELAALKEAWNGDEEETLDILSSFRDAVRMGFPHTDPYYAVLTHFTYSVPVKASDGAVLEDGGAVYDALLLSLCPAKLSAPALGFDEGTVENLRRRWVIGAPCAGFLYPSFSGRCEDRNEAAFFMKKDAGHDLFKSLFTMQEEVVMPDELKSGWNSILTEVGVSAQSASLINESLCESEAASLGKKELRKIVEEAGSDGERFEEEYENVAGERELPVKAISSPKVEVKTDSARIQVPAEKAAFIKTQIIDGVEYILIPVDGKVTVNGTEIIIEP